MPSPAALRIALISDIHGNLPALEAVLADLDRREVDRLFNLGDICYGPLWPRETWQRLQALALPTLTIQGNQDRDLYDHDPGLLPTHPTLRYDVEALGAAGLAWLRGLPKTLSVDEIYACHGTPDSDLVYLLEDVGSGDAQLRSEPELRQLLPARSEAVIVCGHTHTPRSLRLADGPLVVNPGSVGLPAYDDLLPVPHRMQTGSPAARYALIERDEHGRWSAELLSIDYDFESAARQAERNGRADWAGWLRSGLADVPTAA
ncbi:MULTISPECIES: metallophosphoesterase family protein [Hydrocarboniphaga]|jgi:putative phosphoesterase|uniref:Metallophosphoesterase n=1 Tax=Hydrocarboniphaga effusa AP103 TaxID=1172194 RepID=I7ZEQ8_9GAMM|nr:MULTISPECIES: metallophosphoesterase family protein [Hydrocarboniphaga]EIT70379.1 metallophosphoesterase [Hydrocarboniphaga effusa AP103]MDZ4080763.1 metallophosphoesterase family protein [Hydrocarboniphaga sp.]